MHIHIYNKCVAPVSTISSMPAFGVCDPFFLLFARVVRFRYTHVNGMTAAFSAISRETRSASGWRVQLLQFCYDGRFKQLQQRRLWQIHCDHAQMLTGTRKHFNVSSELPLQRRKDTAAVTHTHYTRSPQSIKRTAYI